MDMFSWELGMWRIAAYPNRLEAINVVEDFLDIQ